MYLCQCAKVLTVSPPGDMAILCELHSVILVQCDIARDLHQFISSGSIPSLASRCLFISPEWTWYCYCLFFYYDRGCRAHMDRMEIRRHVQLSQLTNQGLHIHIICVSNQEFALYSLGP